MAWEDLTRPCELTCQELAAPQIHACPDGKRQWPLTRPEDLIDNMATSPAGEDPRYGRCSIQRPQHHRANRTNSYYPSHLLSAPSFDGLFNHVNQARDPSGALQELEPRVYSCGVFGDACLGTMRRRTMMRQARQRYSQPCKNSIYSLPETMKN